MTDNHTELDAEMESGTLPQRVETLAQYLSLTAHALRPAAASLGNLDNPVEVANAARLITSQLDDLVGYSHALRAHIAASNLGTNLLDHISTSDARHTLWHFGDHKHGVQPGSFTKALMLAIAVADSNNTSRLLQAFPGLVLASSMARIETGGMDALRELIESRAA